MYKRARYYDPQTGEFISRDPLGYVDGMSLYRGYFAPGNVDPTGEMERDKNGKIVATNKGKPVGVEHGGAPGTTFTVQEVVLKTDDGTSIQAYSNIGKDPRMDCDCHGVSVGDGEYWINDDQMDKIIKGDGYAKQAKAQIGDLGVYRKNGRVVHSVRVKAIAANGDVTVEGLGGLETQVHVNPATPGAGGGWPDPAAIIEYYRQPATKAGTAKPPCLSPKTNP